MKEINTGRYIQGFYIPNLCNLTDVVIKILDVSAPVSIMPLIDRTSNYAGYVEKNKGRYTIFIDTAILKKDELTDFVASLFIHEIWHVKQMEDGRLSSNSAQTVAVWEGVHYPMTVIPHEIRPWEIEARRMEAEYFSLIKTALYG